VIKFSPGTPVSFTNKTDRHDITEIVLKVALNTINNMVGLWCLTPLSTLLKIWLVYGV
jgi:hypothetical protein